MAPEPGIAAAGRRRLPLPRAALIGGVLVSLLIVAATGFILAELRRKELSDARRELVTLNTVLVEEAARSVQSVDLVLKSVVQAIEADGIATAADFARLKAGRDTHELLMARVSGIPQLDAVTLVAADGRLVNFSRSFPVPAIDLSDRAYFAFLRDTPTADPYVTEPVRNRSNGTWTVYLGRRLAAPDGQFLGLVLGAIDLGYFDRFYRSLNLGGQSAISLWRRDGTLLTREPPAPGVGRQFKLKGFAESFLRDGLDFYEITDSIDGFDRLVATRAMRDYPLIVNVTRTRDEALRDWRGEAVLGTVAAATCIGAIGLMLWALSRQYRADENAARALDERERALSERDEVEAQLRQAQKMEAVGQLTGGIAHDFNNLLTVIKSSTDLLRRPDLPEARRERYVAAISDTVDRASKLTGQLLAFARRQPLKPEAFDAGERMRAVTDMLGTMVGSRIRIARRIAAEPCWVEADVSQFETALVNLAVNARDAMEGEGVLTLRVARASAMPAIRGHGAEPSVFVAVSVSDTGCGIPDDQRNRIFEPFFTTKEVGKGTGLGLSQVFGFAKQSGGNVGVESALGTGTTLTLYLPRIEVGEGRREAAAPPAKAPPTADAGETRRVLVVEDNVAVGTFSTQLLHDLGYETSWASGASEALAILADGRAAFDAVFSDVVMPGMNGVELGRTIAGLYPGLPVVLTSGYSHVLAEDARHGFPLLRKPYAAQELSQVIAESIAGGRVHGEQAPQGRPLL